MNRTLAGYRMRRRPRPGAANYAGISANRTVWMGMLAGGACAGVAGVNEVAGPLGR
jgi:simple sugar transport system permease protein